jgi:Polyketide cyclase / dehydrase and lipid transport
MRPVSASASIDVPRQRVFDLLIDLSIRPAFTDHFIAEYRLARVDPVGEGASARFRLEHAGVWVDTVIEVAEAPHLVRERGRGGRGNRVPWFTVWEIAEGPSPDGSELTVTIWTEPPTIFDRLGETGIGARRLRRDLSRALGRLRDIAETNTPLEHVGIGGADLLPAFNR